MMDGMRVVGFVTAAVGFVTAAAVVWWRATRRYPVTERDRFTYYPLSAVPPPWED